MSFKIVIDSGCDLPAPMRQDPCFMKVPLTINVNGTAFVDDGTLNCVELLRHMKQSEAAPTTACPSPQSYLDVYQCGADDIYVVTLSALLSGSYNSAEQARLLLQEESNKTKVHIFNTCSAVSGEGMVALKIRELASSGMAFEDVVRNTEQFIYEMQTLIVLESLENLRKNGRLNKLQAVVTGALKIKLLLHATPEGEIGKLGQALTIKQALAKLVDRIAADPRHVGLKAGLCHCNCLERALQVKAMLEQKCQFSEILIMEGGGISTVYANEGGIIVAY